MNNYTLSSLSFSTTLLSSFSLHRVNFITSVGLEATKTVLCSNWYCCELIEKVHCFKPTTRRAKATVLHINTKRINS